MFHAKDRPHRTPASSSVLDLTDGRASETLLAFAHAVSEALHALGKEVPLTDVEVRVQPAYEPGDRERVIAELFAMSAMPNRWCFEPIFTRRSRSKSDSSACAPVQGV